jgi:hypothetical protein
MSYIEYRHDNGDQRVKSAIESIELYLNNSHGEPTMSPEDVKASVILIKIALENQRNQLNNLAEIVLEPKKTFIQRLLKK